LSRAGLPQSPRAGAVLLRVLLQRRPGEDPARLLGPAPPVAPRPLRLDDLRCEPRGGGEGPGPTARDHPDLPRNGRVLRAGRRAVLRRRPHGGRRGGALQDGWEGSVTSPTLGKKIGACVMTSIPQALEQAVTCHRAGDLARAEQLYRQVLAIDPAHV